MTKHKKNKRRTQKGGESLVPMPESRGLVPMPETNGWFSGLSNWWSGTSEKAKGLLQGTSEKAKGFIQGADNLVGDSVNKVSNVVSDSVSAAQNTLNKTIDLPGTSDTTVAPAQVKTDLTGQASLPSMTVGGKRKSKSRRRCKTMKGGKNSLGLTYYASPVSGLKVAQPTYWINSNGTKTTSSGGSRKKNLKKSHKTKRNKH